MSIKDRSSNTSSTGIYGRRYNKNNGLSTTSNGLRSLSASIQPKSVGTRIGYLLQKFGEEPYNNSWNSVRWNKTQPTDAYKGHSSRLSKAFEPSISTTILPSNSYSLSPAIKRNLGTLSNNNLDSTKAINNYKDTNTLKSSYTPELRSVSERNEKNNSSYSNSYLAGSYLNRNNNSRTPITSRVSTNNYGNNSISSDYLNSTRRSNSLQTSSNYGKSSISNSYPSPSTYNSRNSMSITSAMANLTSQNGTSKVERPWRQRLADSARMRNLEGTGDIAAKVSSKYMIQRAARRDSATSGDETSYSLKLYSSPLDQNSLSPPYLSSNMKIPYSLNKSNSSMSNNNLNDEQDSGIMSKSTTSRSSWNNTTTFFDKKVISPLNNNTTGGKHMDDIKESGIKTINNKKSIKERNARRNSRKNLLSQTSIENKIDNNKEDYSYETTSSSEDNNKEKMKENRDTSIKKKRKVRKREDLVNNNDFDKHKNEETILDSTLEKTPVTIKRIVKQPSVSEFPAPILSPKVPVVVTIEVINDNNKEEMNKVEEMVNINKNDIEKNTVYNKPNTEYIKRTPIKKYIQTTAEKPMVVDEEEKKSKNKIEKEILKESSDESKYNDVVHFKLPSRLKSNVIEKDTKTPLILASNNKEKKIPPIPGLYVTKDNEINISINKNFISPTPSIPSSQEVVTIIYTNILKNTHEKVIGKFKEIKRKKKKIMVIKSSFDLNNLNTNICESLNYTYYDKKLHNKDFLKKVICIPKKILKNIYFEKEIINNVKKSENITFVGTGKRTESQSIKCKSVSLKNKTLNLDVIKKFEEKLANVTVMTSNIVGVNYNSISKDIYYDDSSYSNDCLTPKAMTDEPTNMDVSLTLQLKTFKVMERSSAPPESIYNKNKNIETRASIVLKRLRSEDPAIYDMQPSIIPEYSQKYIHLKADPNYIPGDPIILPDTSILEEYVRRKRGNLEKYIHEPIIEETSPISPYSNNTLSHCESPSIASTISEYHPPPPVKIIEPNFAYKGNIYKLKSFVKPQLNCSENTSTSSMIDMINFNLNKPKLITNNNEGNSFLNQIRRPLRNREPITPSKINKVFDKPHSAFEERMQNQAKAVVLKKSNPSLSSSYSVSNSNKPNESLNTSIDVTWSLPDTLNNNKRRLSADNSNQNAPAHTNNLNNNLMAFNNNMTSKQTLAQSFAQAAAAASQPRHERYAAHLPVSNNNNNNQQIHKDSSGRQSTTSIDSNNSMVLEKASTQVEQMIDNAKYKHQQSRNKFKDAIEYLDQIFEDFKKDVKTDEKKEIVRNKITTSFPTNTGYYIHNPTGTSNINNVKNVHNNISNNGHISSNNLSRNHSYSQNNSLIEDNNVEISETIRLPPPNKKLSSDRLDFTQKWLVNDIKSWAHSPKLESTTNRDPKSFDYDERSIGSCSAEVAAINCNEKEPKQQSIYKIKDNNEGLKKQQSNSCLIKPHPYRPQPFPIEGASLKKIPSMDQMHGNVYQPTGSQFFKPPSMTSLNDFSTNSVRAQSQEYQFPGNEYNNNGIYMKPNDIRDCQKNMIKSNKQQQFGSIQSLPDAGMMLRNTNGGSLKINKKKNDAMSAIDALVAELEMNVSDENCKRRSFPLNNNNNNNGKNDNYAKINREYEKPINRNIIINNKIPSKPLTKNNKINNDPHQLDEMANLLTNVVNDIGNSNNNTRRGGLNVTQGNEGSNKLMHNPFEKINNEKIGNSRVEAMHHMFENKGIHNDNNNFVTGVNNHFNQYGSQKSINNAWKRHSINQKKTSGQNSLEEENYYEITDFGTNNLKQKVPSKVSLNNSSTYTEYIPSFPNSQPPSCPPQNSSANSSNHGYYSSTNSSSATITAHNNIPINNRLIKNPSTMSENINQTSLSRQGSIIDRQSLTSQNQSIYNEEEDDGFYDNILSNNEERHYSSRGNDISDNISISSTKYSTAPRSSGNKLSNLLRKFSIGNSTHVKPPATGSFISLNKMPLNDPIHNISNKRSNLMKSNSLSMEPWEKQVFQGQVSGRKSPGNISQVSKKSSLGSRIKNSIFGSKKNLKNIY